MLLNVHIHNKCIERRSGKERNETLSSRIAVHVAALHGRCLFNNLL